jgi:UDP-N-acetyl-D-glucosamine dehydrogenase
VRLAGYEPRFITFADEINRHMPAYVVQLVADALNDRARSVRDARILVLGVAYKADVSDTRDSPALEIIESLLAKGARVQYHDPHVPSITVRGAVMASCPAVRAAEHDLVLILTAHAAYDWRAIVADAAVVVDTRNATAGVPDTGRVIRL